MSEIIVANERYNQAVELHNNIMLNGSIAAQALATMCHDLKVMRDEKLYKEMGFEKFEEYCEEKVGIKSRQAYTYISTYEKLGQNVIEKHAHIGITKLELLSAINPVDRIEILENEDLGDMSVSEVKELVARNTEQAEQLSLLNDELEDKKTREEDLEEQLLKLREENKELKERPIEVSSKPTDEEISKLRQDIEKEITEQAEQKAKTELEEKYKKKIDKAKESATKEANANKQKEIDEAVKKAVAESNEKLLKEKVELVRTLASSKNEMLRLENELKTADTSTQKVNIYFTALQDTLNNLLTTVKEIENKEQKETLKSAVTSALSNVIETVKKV